MVQLVPSANAKFVQDGKSIDYTADPDIDVAVGEVVVQGELVGIAVRGVPKGTVGALAVTGVFDLPKTVGSGEAIGAGADVYWDATNIVVTTDSATGANKKLGRTVAAAGDNDATVRVRLSQ